MRPCPRCKQHLPDDRFTKGRWCADCQQKYVQENQDMLRQRLQGAVKAGSDQAEAEGRCRWRDGRCPKPVETDGMCHVHYRMDLVRRHNDYLTPLREQGFKL